MYHVVLDIKALIYNELGSFTLCLSLPPVVGGFNIYNNMSKILMYTS
jgi:hypothetical protein